mmetsp:Transcript_1500/g.3197  ORF Transcript_1500/g.3197 Transcript_1500/m.3197 type:complete len:91 (-) Transcript_1500:312-584(-)
MSSSSSSPAHMNCRAFLTFLAGLLTGGGAAAAISPRPFVGDDGATTGEAGPAGPEPPVPSPPSTPSRMSQFRDLRRDIRWDMLVHFPPFR